MIIQEPQLIVVEQEQNKSEKISDIIIRYQILNSKLDQILERMKNKKNR